MSNALKRKFNAAHPQSHNDGNTAMETIELRQSKDIFLGLCGFVGCGIKTVVDVTKEIAENWGYNVIHIRISDLMLDNLYFEKSLIDENYNKDLDRHLALQKLGNELRRHHKRKELLSEAAIAAISAKKIKESSNAGPNVYIIDQLKRPEEIELFRVIYQHNFYLLGILRDQEHRIRNLKEDGASKNDIPKIINVDDKSDDEYGQRTSQAILDSDFFIKNNQSQKKDLERKIDRFFGLIHGKNGLTPSLNEKGMYAAFTASLQSACLSRQVGAALFDDEGNLLAVGKNDVPKAGGGLYVSDDGDKDHRCVHKSGKCYNVTNKLKIKDKISNIISNELKDVIGNDAAFELILKKITNKVPDITEAIYKGTKIASIMEYSRSIHAEMDVITTMARKSSEGAKGKILYTTTYPCHNCARHIVSSGIKKVVYIEPFEKSLALDLHDDAITKSEDSSKVIFTDYEGVSPRRYSKFFMPTDERKDDKTGVANKFNTKYKNHIDVQYLDSHRDYEGMVAQKFLIEVSKQEVPSSS